MKRLKNLWSWIYDNTFAILSGTLAAESLIVKDPVGMGLAVYFAVVHFGRKKTTFNFTIEITPPKEPKHGNE